MPGGGPPIIPGMVGGIIGGISLYARRSLADLGLCHRLRSAQPEAPCSPCCRIPSSLWNTTALHRASLWCYLELHPSHTSFWLVPRNLLFLLLRHRYTCFLPWPAVTRPSASLPGPGLRPRILPFVLTLR